MIGHQEQLLSKTIMEHRFVILIDNKLHTFDKFEDIPMKIDNVIEFRPKFIPPPHTHEEHVINDQWHDKFKELLKRETK